MNAKTKLAELLMLGRTPRHEGEVNGLVFALTGTDVNFRFCREAVQDVCSLLSWGYKPIGNSGWEIDWKDEVDETYLESRGVIVC